MGDYALSGRVDRTFWAPAYRVSIVLLTKIQDFKESTYPLDTGPPCPTEESPKPTSTCSFGRLPVIALTTFSNVAWRRLYTCDRQVLSAKL